MTTKAEHIAWCKQRALEYVDMGDLPNAMSSMVSDMRIHPETGGDVTLMLEPGMAAARDGDADAVRRWIEGF